MSKKKKKSLDFDLSAAICRVEVYASKQGKVLTQPVEVSGFGRLAGPSVKEGMSHKQIL